MIWKNSNKARSVFVWTRVISLAFLIAIGLLMAGCAHKYGKVAIEWSRMMREEQVNPIFPPREDIRVGDAYLFNEDPNKDIELDKVKSFLPIPVLFSRLNIESINQEEYTKRSPYPLTPTNELREAKETVKTVTITNDTQGKLYTNTVIVEGNGLKELPAYVEATEEGIFSESEPNRLRHVAFPEFSFAKIDQKSLQAVIPVESLTLALGLRSSKATEGYLKVSSGESVSLPATEVFARWTASMGAMIQGESTKGCITGNYAALLNQLAQQASRSSSTNAREFYIDLITEAYYARSIDIAFTSKSSMGGGINVAGSAISNSLAATAAAVERAKQLNAINEETLSKTTPGGRITFTSVSDFGIGLRRTYARPICVGTRGVVIRVIQSNAGNWEIVGVSPNDGTKPQIYPSVLNK